MGHRNFAATVIVLDMMGSITAQPSAVASYAQERSAHMQLIFAGISILVFLLTAVNVGPLNLGGWLNAAIFIPLVLLVVYSLARIQPKKTRGEKDSNK